MIKVTDFKWTEDISGASILVMNSEAITSRRTPVNPKERYIVGKHKKTGKVAVFTPEDFEEFKRIIKNYEQ